MSVAALKPVEFRMGCQMASRQPFLLHTAPLLTGANFVVVGLVALRTIPQPDCELFFRCLHHPGIGKIISVRANGGHIAVDSGLDLM